jgi:hypothetical protein
MVEQHRLIFLVSQPRAGSTLLQKVVTNSPEIDTASEPWLALPFLSILKPDALKSGYRHFLAIRAIADFNKKFDKEETYTAGIRKFLLEMYPGNGTKWFLDKTPRYYEILPELRGYFPESTLIILKRHPFDALYSMIKTWSRGAFSPEMLRTFYRDFMNAPVLLQNFLDSPQANSQNVVVLKYEDLVQNPESVISALFQKLGVEFKPEFLIADNPKVKGIFGDDVYKQKSNPEISPKGLRRWEAEMKNLEFRSFFLGYANHLGPDFFVKYGYSLDESLLKMKYKKKYFMKIMEKVGSPVS